MKTLYLDCFSGASGDMLVGALLDAGADFDRLKTALDSLGVEGFAISAEKVVKKGVTATQFHVHVDEHDHHPHRHLRHVLEIIERGELPQSVKDAAAETFRRIAEVEADIHGTTVEKIHFHEVGAIDSIVDVVSAHFCLHDLGVERTHATPMPTGSGTVKCAHGIMPVPAPATVRLLKDVPTYSGDVQAEMVTPTGAAIVAQVAESFGPMPLMTIQSVGYGSGTRDLPDRPNVLRAILGESDEAAGETEPITVIEANIDDMNPELYPALVEAALASGARDAFITPIVGKKGRPACLATVLCDPAKTQELTACLFRHSTTLGVRMRTEQRVCLRREWKVAKTPWGDVRVKVGYFDGRASNLAPEFEDCRRRAEDAGVAVREVYAAAQASASRGELHDAS